MNTPRPTSKLSRTALLALVISSMIGAGIYSLPSSFSKVTGIAGALTAWGIAGSGMFMLALVFNNLAQRKPDLDSGIFAYAFAGFGNYAGFISTLGFWGGCCVANVSFFVLIKSTLGMFFPVFGDGSTPFAVITSSALLWAFHFMVLRGIKGATYLNTIVGAIKVSTLLICVFLMYCFLDWDIFFANIWNSGTDTPMAIAADLVDEYGMVAVSAVRMAEETHVSFFSQVRSTMLITVFVFVGIEGASVFSRYAKNRKDVGIATVVGFLIVWGLLVLVTILSFGIMPRAELAQLHQPSVAGVLQHIDRTRGALFVSFAVIVSVMGAFLSWLLLAAESLFSAAKSKIMPSFLARENKNKVPAAALWLSNVLTQAFLIVTIFTDYAYTLALELTSSLCLVPYLLVGAFALKLAWTGDTYQPASKQRTFDLVVSGIATAYAALMLYSGGIEYLLLTTLFYFPCTLLFVKARREQGKTVFTRLEKLVFLAMGMAAAIALLLLATGEISIL